MTTDRLLLREEVAELLRVPARTLYQWRAQGVGPHAVRVGRRLVYRESDVRAWLDAQFEAAS